MLRDTLVINDKGHLEIGGVDCADLAAQFGTPLYVMDEAHIRKVCRAYRKVLADKYPDSLVCYASKAFSCQAIYNIVGSEGLGADVVSGGELYTALTAGFDMSKVYFHGNNKLSHEVDAALNAGVHAIVADGFSDVELLRAAVKRTGVTAKVLLRVNVGIDAHTHQFIQTARTDSKFGVSLSDGTAKELVDILSKTEGIEFLGLHCHIGSQIFELTPFSLAVDKFTDFVAEIYRDLGVVVKELNFGGGYGIRYTETDKPYAPEFYIDAVVTRMLERIEEKGIMAPRLIFEPGRSIVGEAGITLYSIGAVKQIKGIKKYLAVDGGMFDNPRYIMYQADYTCMLANRATDEESETASIVGKCCESGDVLVPECRLPKAERGDLLAVFSTGAYNYSMASHYNRNLIPPVILVNNGAAEYIVRPETYEDVIARDVMPQRLKR